MTIYSKTVKNLRSIDPTKMGTTTVKLNTTTYIFQTGIILELDDQLGAGMYQDELAVGYVIPDIGNGQTGILPVERTEINEADVQLTDEYFGKCILTHVDNFMDDTIVKATVAKKFSGEVLFSGVQIIHYDDSQQLVFHMPEYAWDAHDICLFDKVRQLEIFREPVRNKLSGSTMIMLDTLSYKPGFYSIKANWPNGWTHEIHFTKLIPGFPHDEVYQHPKGNITTVQTDNSYTLFDAKNLEIINNEQQKKENLTSFSTRRMEYQQDGRGGTMNYIGDNGHIVFDWELAAGNGVLIIFVKPPEFWETGTRTSLSERESILEFVAKSVISDKAPGCVYEIYDNFININRY